MNGPKSVQFFNRRTMISPEVGVQHPVFVFPKTTNQDSIAVYYWQETRQFYRPGRWIYYLADLANEIDTQLTANQKLDGTPIDDAELFPDIDPRSEHYHR